MSGKPYTIREMKSIVDHLTENNLYGETKGRKMWTDFADSKKTVRTWQSLKETFLKRILPDITNPYYKLNADQILSFKRCIDLTNKDKKLKFSHVDTSPNNGVSGDKDPPCSSKKKEENSTGEETHCSKIVHDRASTETLILDTCYQTAEDIQRDLESTDGEQDKEMEKNISKPPIKSVRDFIEYTEPLTPMLQEVLDDFATDEDCSDTERPMQIDENYATPDEILDVPTNPTSSQSILNPNRTQNTTKLATTGEKDEEKVESNKQKSENNIQSVKETDGTQLENVMVLVDEALEKDIDHDLTVQKEKQDKETNSFESSVPMTDSLLPNNQEAVKNSTFSSPTPSTSIGKGDDKEVNTKEAQDDINLLSSNYNLISDDEPEPKGSEESIKKDSKEKSNNNKPNNHNVIQNVTSPKKVHVSDDKVHEIHSDTSASVKDAALQDENPCLKSVSLYAEQLVTTKYSDSDSNIKDNPNNEQKSREQMNDQTKENIDQRNGTKSSEYQNNYKGNPKGKSNEGVILRNSRTTSESVDDSEVNHRPLARSSLKKQKDEKLASLFGFSSGRAVKSRPLSSRKRTISHQMHSDSSEWTSTSESEYVSPPNGRRNRHARKYLKPRSARVLSLEEEGGLFVMLGKKIYPLVKDGKNIKNYVTFLPESDPEEDDSYWKSKYIEERKRTADLKKKLVHSKSNGDRDKEEKESSVSSPSLITPLNENRASRQESLVLGELMRRDSEVLEKSSSHDTLKIKFTKNDQEVQLEGHWQHINPVLAQVVSMLHKEPAQKKKSDSVTCVELSSGNTTPIDANAAGVHEKINEIESEIFKEIEEKDTNEPALEHNEVQDSNTVGNAGDLNAESVKKPQVTQRKKRGRPRKVSEPTVAQSPAKRPKKSTDRSDVDETKAGELLKKATNEEKVKSGTPNVGRHPKSPRKLLNDINPKAKATRKSTSKTPNASVDVSENTVDIIVEEDEEVRYKFPSPVPKGQDTSTKTNKSKESPKMHLPITSPDSLSRHSINSSQGYQDSDTSPFNINIRRKRRLSVSAISIKGRKMQRKHRSRSFPLLIQRDSDQNDSSSNSTFKIIRREQSTIHSEIYKSESYQFLMPRRQRLENIDEAKNEIDALEDKIRGLREEILQASNPTTRSDPASSSNVSLPMSPELSIVENLSVSKSAIAEISDLPTLNEMECNTMPTTFNNKYLMTAVDVSMPLMTQHCELQEAYRKHVMAALSNLSDAPNSAGRNLSTDSSMKISISSESILKNLSAVNVETSDSLDRRLEQLLLESAQKPLKQNREEIMEVDTQVKKKAGSRKRCSTPHKKKSVKNIKKVIEQPVIIEEECKAQCSRGVRRSCPPSINVVHCEYNAPDNIEINLPEGADVSNVTKRKRVKKDIIKIKIKPKDKPQKKKNDRKKKNVSQSSGLTEGENESGVFLHELDDSGDLIHNHSETCLKCGDCAGEDSVEFIETTTKSIISLNSSSLTSENKENLSRNSMDSGKMTPELYCDNAQCATDLRDARSTEVQSADSGNTVYFTPFVSRCNSALTEDLSNEAPISKPPYRPSKWYLLSDEESTSSYLDVLDNDTPSYGANLKQIFPITCAIPDLSTITEMSEKNDSQKPSLDVEDSIRDTN